MLVQHLSNITCQWRPDQQRDALHDGDQAQGGGEAAHLHHVHEDGEHQGAHHAHGQPVDDDEGHQDGEGGPHAADGVAEPVDQQGGGEHVDVPPFEPGHVEDDPEDGADHDVDHAQDGQQQGGASLLHAVSRGVRNQVDQGDHKAQHHPGEAHGVHAVASVAAELIKGHVFAQAAAQESPGSSQPPRLPPARFLLGEPRPVVHRRLTPTPGDPQGSHHRPAHAAVQQDGPQHQEAASPAQLGVEEVPQDRQHAQPQGGAHGRHGVGERPPPHKVVSEDGHGRLEAEAEAEAWGEGQRQKEPLAELLVLVLVLVPVLVPVLGGSRSL